MSENGGAATETGGMTGTLAEGQDGMGAGNGADGNGAGLQGAADPASDPARFADPFKHYHKGLPHDAFGEVIPGAFDSLKKAVSKPYSPADFEAITMGLGLFGRKLTSPQAGLAMDTQGPLPSSLMMPNPPDVSSPEAAAEAAELYWMALLRDVPFTQFGTDPRIKQAANDLSRFQAVQSFHNDNKNTPEYQKPEGRHSAVGVLDKNGKITPETIFRGFTPGDLAGPYLSQFMLWDIPYGSLTISQRQKTVVSGKDYLTRFDEWLSVQNGFGNALINSDVFDPERRYIRNMRDLGQYVHVDALYEAYLNACLILLGMNAPKDAGNPYENSKNQAGFATFGDPHILSLVCEVATRALKAVWYQKWVVHLRLRPEAYGGLVHLKLAGHNGAKKDYPLHEDILRSEAVHLAFSRNGSYLLPMAFPEGSPTHPAYGAGHATVAGACVTILKAWFDEDHVLPNPVVPSEDGTELVPYDGPDKNALTVGGELDKVAANVAIGRDMAGVHWRTDYTESVKLGETVSVCILKRQSRDYNERLGAAFDRHPSFTLRRFNGEKITIIDGKVLNADDVVDGQIKEGAEEHPDFNECGAMNAVLDQAAPGALAQI